ncbi:DUF3667 domain-containing protein [Flavobacteriaceae bacterium R38]|nr:DUF3667 domain-containing protein [Flavobacteriaceae bacterium R38]
MASTCSYCPHCGQKTDENLTFGVLFNNTISNYFSYDARFLKSFIPLMFKPGFVAREFVNGKRLRYLHPAQYYLFVSVIFFFLFSISTRSGQESVDQMFEKGLENSKTTLDSIQIRTPDSVALSETKKILSDSNIPIPKEGREAILKSLDSISNNDDSGFETSFSTIDGASLGGREFKKLDSLIAIEASQKEKLAVFGVTDSTGTVTRFIAKQSLKMYENNAQGLLGAFYDTIPISMFFLIPIFAMILKFLYYKRVSFAHSMVFSFYFFTFLFIVLSIDLLVNFVIAIPNWIDVLVVLSTVIYLLISMKRFYQQNYFVSFLKMSILTFTYFIMIIPFSLLVMGLIAFLTY